MTLFDPTNPFDEPADIDMAKPKQQQQQIQPPGTPLVEAVYLVVETQKQYLPRAIRHTVIPLPPGARIHDGGEIVEFDRGSSWTVAMVVTKWRDQFRRAQVQIYLSHIDNGQDPRTNFGTLQ